MNKKIFALGAIILLAISSLAFALARGPEDSNSNEVYDFDSCVKKTGISTDSIPSECNYDGRNYVDGEDDKMNYEACVSLGGAIQETAPPRCVIEGNTYIQGEDEKPVPTLYNNRFTRFVYGNMGGVSDATLDKYKAHCSSVGGTFNSCGSFCAQGESCIASCALTCENVLASDEDKTEFKVKGDEVEFKYKSDESEYKVKYADGDEYTFESEFKIKNMMKDGFNVEDIDGKIRVVNVLPEDALRKAFDSDATDVKIRLEEKDYDNVPRVIYNIDGDSNGKFLGLFKIKARYQAQIDANSGDVLHWNGPWWAFLITGEKNPVEYAEGDVIVKDYDSCVAVTGISTDGIPSECTYEGNTYKQEIKSDVKEDEEKIVDFASCVNAGYPVQETAPSRCVYKDMVFVDIPSDSTVNQNNANNLVWMTPDLTNCEDIGGVYEEQQIQCITTPCYPVKKCTLNGKVYTEEFVEGFSAQTLCASINGVFNSAAYRCVDSNGMKYVFAMP